MEHSAGHSLVVLSLCLTLMAAAAEGKVVRGSVTLSPDSPVVLLSKFAFGTGISRTEANIIVPGAQTVDALLVLDEDWDRFLSASCPQKFEIARAKHTVHGKGEVYQPLKQHVRPHVWYVAVANCNPTATIPVNFEIQFLNRQDSHFPFDQEGLYELYTIVLLVFFVAGVFYCYRLLGSVKTLGTTPPMLIILSCVLVFEFVRVLLEWINLRVFSASGEAYWTLELFSELLLWGSQLLLSFMFIALSSGWTLTHPTIAPNFPLLNPLISGAIVFVHMVVVLWSRLSDDPTKHHDWESLPGFIFAVLRLLLFAWSFYLLKETAKEVSNHNAKFLFITRLGVFITLWFLSFPFLLLLATIFAEYLRTKVITIGLVTVQSVALFGLANLFLSRGRFFKLSTLSDSILPSAGSCNDLKSMGHARQNSATFVDPKRAMSGPVPAIRASHSQPVLHG